MRRGRKIQRGWKHAAMVASVAIAIVALVLVTACGPDRVQRAAIESAIEWSDSLRRRPMAGHHRSDPLDIPIAATSDSDSVLFVNIDYRPRIHEGPVRICPDPLPQVPVRPPETP